MQPTPVDFVPDPTSDVPAGPWVEQAACRGCDPALFFPERGENPTAAKAVCAECPVRLPCLEYALAVGERHGVWGGMSERERRKLRRQRNRHGAA